MLFTFEMLICGSGDDSTVVMLLGLKCSDLFRSFPFCQ